MLQYETLPPSLAGLLWAFRSCFTAPSFRMFCALAGGLVARPARRTVCGMLTGAGLATVWHHSRAHWFLGHARWSVEQVGLVLLRLIVSGLLPAGADVLVAVDDTLLRRSGRKVYAAAWQHDGAAKGPRKNKVSWGNCWVVAGVIVTLPFLDRPVCLPVAAALWRKDGPTKQVLACGLITGIAAACPGRQVHVVADAWYAGMDGAPGAARGGTRDRGLPAGVSLTSRLRANAALFAIADPATGSRGRPRRIGARIGSPKHLAATATWTTTQVHRYGRTTTVQIAETRCLWYGVYRSRTVRVILLRDTITGTTKTGKAKTGKAKTGKAKATAGKAGKTAGYDLALVTTDLDSPAETIIERYAARWSIEVAFEDATQITGVGEARNRTRTAVQRTVPFGLFVQSLVILWYAQHGHHPSIAAERRRQAPWYRTKTQPSYQDMITKLRRTLIAARFLGGKPPTLTPEEIHTIQLTWAEAAA
jgi:hypothetical protein